MRFALLVQLGENNPAVYNRRRVAFRNRSCPIQNLNPLSLTVANRVFKGKMARRQTSSQQLVRRVQIILLIAQGKNNQQVVQAMGIHRETVRQWRSRWLSTTARLSAVETTADDKQLMHSVESLLADEPRPGTQRPFQSEADCGNFSYGMRKTGCFWLSTQSLNSPRFESRGHQTTDCGTNFCAPCGAFFKRRRRCNRTAT